MSGTTDIFSWDSGMPSSIITALRFSRVDGALGQPRKNWNSIIVVGLIDDGDKDTLHFGTNISRSIGRLFVFNARHHTCNHNGLMYGANKTIIDIHYLAYGSISING